MGILSTFKKVSTFAPPTFVLYLLSSTQLDSVTVGFRSWYPASLRILILRATYIPRSLPPCLARIEGIFTGLFSWVGLSAIFDKQLSRLDFSLPGLSVKMAVQPNAFLCIRTVLYPVEWIRLIKKAKDRRAAKKANGRDPEKPEFKDYKIVYCPETGSWKTVLRKQGGSAQGSTSGSSCESVHMEVEVVLASRGKEQAL